MCGIAGIVYSDTGKRADGEVLRRMNTALTHRGPDDEGYYLERNVGLAMRRLSIIDLEGGHQPIANERGTVWTVFNGEIYNFLELREELIKKGHRFKTRTDTEVIVHLYEEDGKEFVNKLRGMFAIALWDKEKEALLLYRDRVGIKPLHYRIKNGSLVFGSEIKAILEYPEVGRDLSLSAISDYVSFSYVPAPRTIYRDIQKLLPGHFLEYRGGSIKTERYWDFEYRPDRKVSEGEWSERLRAALEESVRMHMISDV
ncbi:MAG TPA: asparagine synthase (glutamine-hydrolyzing), partial [Candidatus Omnitrophota bacterium]|nr:asparagine synthase (glutamine-hydrolyzing) [Candidatus Omnitrophota bacterium]